MPTDSENVQPISFSEFYEALAECGEVPHSDYKKEGFKSAKEWAKLWNLSAKTVRDYIQKAEGVGLLEKRMASEPNINGHMRAIPVYKFLKGKPK